jgi:hypothetical protein
VTGGDRRGDREQHERNYPDVVAAGSLAAALSDALVQQGSRLPVGREFFGVQSRSFARCDHGDRFIQMYIGLDERLFTTGLWENHIEVAHADTSDIDEAARTIRQWLEDRVRASTLAAEFPGVHMHEEGLSYERGTYLEDEWRRLIERTRNEKHSELFHWDDLESLIRVASHHPELRKARDRAGGSRREAKAWNQTRDRGDIDRAAVRRRDYLAPVRRRRISVVDDEPPAVPGPGVVGSGRHRDITGVKPRDASRDDVPGDVHGVAHGHEVDGVVVSGDRSVFAGLPEVRSIGGVICDRRDVRVLARPAVTACRYEQRSRIWTQGQRRDAATAAPARKVSYSATQCSEPSVVS